MYADDNQSRYGFASHRQLTQMCRFIIDGDIRQKNEFYTSTVIKEMLRARRDGEKDAAGAEYDKFFVKLVPKECYFCLGTPDQVKAYEAKVSGK